MSGTTHPKTQNPHFITVAGFYKSVLDRLGTPPSSEPRLEEKKGSGSDEKWRLDPSPKILSTAELNAGAERESEEQCQSLWDLRDPKKPAFSQACWKWFFAEAAKQHDIPLGSPAWRHLVQYASQYVFAPIFQKLPDDFFESASLESKNNQPDLSPLPEIERESSLDKTGIKQEMESLMRELGLGFLEELNKQAILSKKKEFSYWNSLIAALSATILMALLTIVLADSAAMMVLVLAFHSAPLLCSATFLIVFLVRELTDYFVLTPFFTDPFESLKLKPESSTGTQKLLAFSHHAFLCGALFTLAALMLLSIESASPGIPILVALVPSAGGVLTAGGPVLLAFVAFLSGVALIGFGYLCAMGWKWWRLESELPVAKIPPAQSSSARADGLMGQPASFEREGNLAPVLRPLHQDGVSASVGYRG